MFKAYRMIVDVGRQSVQRDRRRVDCISASGSASRLERARVRCQRLSLTSARIRHMMTLRTTEAALILLRPNGRWGRVNPVLEHRSHQRWLEGMHDIPRRSLPIVCRVAVG